MSEASSLDAAIAAVAVPQCGAFSIRQARVCGATYNHIERWCATGRWLRGPGHILQLPGFRASFVQRLWWALLLAPDGAVVSHWAAAALHRLTGFAANRFTITVPHGRRHRNPIAQVFQTSAMPEIVRIGGLPVTPVPRTLVDCGRLVGPIRLGSAVDDADGDGKCTIAELQREFLVLAKPGRNGITTMGTVLGVRSEQGYVPPRATLERHLDRVLDRTGVTFEKEVALPGCEWSEERVDRLCREPIKLIVEGDGRRWHTRVRDFARDARRRRDSMAAGFPTVNYLYPELVDNSDGVDAELRRILGLPRR